MSGSCDWLRLGQDATDRQCLLRSPAAAGRIPRLISTRGRAITNDWRISMARAIVGNRATSGNDRRSMYDQSWRPATDGRGAYDQSIVASRDRSYEHSWHPVTDRTRTDGTINRWVQRPIARSIVASCDRSYDQSLRPITDRTINRGTKRFGIAG